MAAAVTKKQQHPPAAAASTGEPAAVVDPKFEWAEKANSYVLRLSLPDFRKDDFRVQVDGAGRLTVRGSRPSGTGAYSQSSFSKVFQLPATASLDDIAGRFEAGVLTLTVPKRAVADGGAGGAGATAPTSMEEIKRKQPSVAKEEGATGDVKKTEAKEEIGKEDTLKKAMDEATNKAQEKKTQEEDEKAKSRNQEQQKAALAPAKEEVKPNAPQGAAASPPQKPDVATAGTDKAKAAVAIETLAERVRRRGKEERANAAKAGQEKKPKPTAAHWKERVQGELKVLTDMKWVDGVVEAARKNKEVVAVGIAAFSLGFLVSQKLFRM